MNRFSSFLSMNLFMFLVQACIFPSSRPEAFTASVEVDMGGSVIFSNLSEFENSRYYSSGPYFFRELWVCEKAYDDVYGECKDIMWHLELSDQLVRFSAKLVDRVIYGYPIDGLKESVNAKPLKIDTVYEFYCGTNSPPIKRLFIIRRDEVRNLFVEELN